MGVFWNRYYFTVSGQVGYPNRAIIATVSFTKRNVFHIARRLQIILYKLAQEKSDEVWRGRGTPLRSQYARGPTQQCLTGSDIRCNASSSPLPPECQVPLSGHRNDVPKESVQVLQIMLQRTVISSVVFSSRHCPVNVERK